MCAHQAASCSCSSPFDNTWAVRQAGCWPADMVCMCCRPLPAVLPLTKQLSVVSGSLWSKTLQGARAQRIEMLLLHEFHERKFILPDKLTARDKAAQVAAQSAKAAKGKGAGKGKKGIKAEPGAAGGADAEEEVGCAGRGLGTAWGEALDLQAARSAQLMESSCDGWLRRRLQMCRDKHTGLMLLCLCMQYDGPAPPEDEEEEAAAPAAAPTGVCTSQRQASLPLP